MLLRVGGSCFIAVVLLILSGCELGSDEEPIIVPFVDQEFSFDLWENLSSDANSALEVSMQTIEEGECLNTLILSSFEQDNLELKLTLFEILDPENCDPGIAPAQGMEVVADIPAGVYGLNIELKGIVTNPGTLTVNSQSYKVEMDEENGIQWLHNELLRVPNDAVWGYLNYTDGNSLVQAEAFVDDLRTISTEIEPTDGYYGHFVINGGEQVKVAEMPTQGDFVSFLFRYADDRTNLDQLVEEYRMNAPAGAVLVLRDDRGNEW